MELELGNERGAAGANDFLADGAARPQILPPSTPPPFLLDTRAAMDDDAKAEAKQLAAEEQAIEIFKVK